MKTKSQIIKEVFKGFIENPDTRAMEVLEFSDVLKCVYLTSEGQKCAVGKCMLKGNWQQINGDINDLTTLYNIDSILKKAYRGHELGFWGDLQSLHDRNKYWTPNGLSELGKSYYNLLLDRYK